MAAAARIRPLLPLTPAPRSPRDLLRGALGATTSRHAHRPGQRSRTASRSWIRPRASADSGTEQATYDANASQAPPAPPPPYHQPQYMYSAVPQYPAPPPTYQAPPKSGWPPLVWIAIGMGLGFVLGKVFEFVRGGPEAMQQRAAQMMMEQMFKQMNNQPGMAGGMGMPGMGMPGGYPPYTPPAAYASPAPQTVDVQPEPEKPKPKPDTSSTTTASGSTAKKPEDASPRSTAKSYFTDYDKQETKSSASSAGSSGSAAAGAGSAFGAGASRASGTGGSTVDMLEQMMRDPEMQKTLYPYLPEPMRNPETMEWMLSQPEYRQQMEQMMSQMGGPAGMPNMGGGMPDLNSPEVKAQFDQLGMSPQEVVSKILSDPELAQAFQNPKVQSAIMELSTNPMAMVKYQNDPEIMGLITKLSAVFPQAGMPPPPPRS